MKRAAFLLGCALLLPSAGRASMLCQTPGADGAMEQQIAQDPRGAIQALRDPLRAPSASPDVEAHRFAMLADAYWVTGDLAQGRAAIASGLAALGDAADAPLRRRLQLRGFMIQAEQGNVDAAAAGFEAAAATAPADAPDTACIRIQHGYLRQQTGHSREAFADLNSAYRIAQASGAASTRMLAATLLSYVYTASGFPDEARQYANEIVDYARQANDQHWLAEGYLRLGDVASLLQDYDEAVAQFSRAHSLLQDAGLALDAQAVQQRLCATLVRLPQLDRARATCRETYRTAVALNVPRMASAALGSLGEIELRDGHPGEARTLFDRALAGGDGDAGRTRAAELHRLRGQARAGTGDFAGAYADMSAYLDWLSHSDRLARDLGQIAVTRARFEAAIQEQQALRARDAARSEAQKASQRLIERSTLMTGALVVIAMGATIMWARRRRQDSERSARLAEERMTAMSRLTGGIAHDFNNQLTVLMQATGLLTHHPAIAADDGARKLLQAIRHVGEACALVTAQMLSFSRQQNLHPQAVRLGALLDELRPALEHCAGERVAIRYTTDTPEPVAFVDHRQLESALMNLVGNARDAMPDGGIVDVRASRAGAEDVLIEVIDEGCGMPADVLARATEPFYSTKPVGAGSGLGLSMVHGFATQSGGSLTLTSQPGHGTVVRLTLPAAGA